MAGRAGRVMWAQGIVVQDWQGIHTLPLPCSSWCACARREQLEQEEIPHEVVSSAHSPLYSRLPPIPS